MKESTIHEIFVSRDDDDVKKEKILAALKKGADINAGGGYYSAQPLTMCFENGNYDMAEFLIQNGADPWYINPVTGRNCFNAWADSNEGVGDLDRGMILLATYAAWKKPEWCEIYLKLIFEKGWPRANAHISGNLENMRKYK